MYVLECLNDPKTQFMDCSGEDIYKSTCYCIKNDINPINEFTLENNDLYSDENITVFKDPQSNLKWNYSIPKILNDCFKWHDGYSWACSTVKNNIAQSYCSCFSLDNSFIRKHDFVETKSVFKSAKNLIFPIKHEEIKYDFIDQNKNKMHFLNAYNSNIQYKEELSIFVNNFIIYLLILSILSFFFIYLNFRNKKRRKLQQFQDKSSLRPLLI